MLTAAALAVLLQSAQPLAAPGQAAPQLTAPGLAATEQAALAQCLDRFLATQPPVTTEIGDFTNALATACFQEERAYRAGYVAAAAARGVRQVPADSEAHRNALLLRNARRDVYLAAQQTCRR